MDNKDKERFGKNVDEALGHTLALYEAGRKMGIDKVIYGSSLVQKHGVKALFYGAMLCVFPLTIAQLHRTSQIRQDYFNERYTPVVEKTNEVRTVNYKVN